MPRLATFGVPVPNYVRRERMAKYEHGVKFDYPKDHDGFTSHVVRRGAEKTATGGVWFFWLCLVLLAIGIATTSVVGGCVVGGVGLFLYGAAANETRKKKKARIAAAAERQVIIAQADATLARLAASSTKA
jgi:hypothetical protein